MNIIPNEIKILKSVLEEMNLLTGEGEDLDFE